MVSDSIGKDLQPADLIEFKNFYDFYAHWGVYVGDGDVVHVIGNVEAGQNNSLPNSVAEGLAAFVGAVDTYVRKDRIHKVAGNRTFFRNNQLDSSYSPLPTTQIVRKCNSLVGTKWDYKLLSSNCEHFASEMRYGVPVSLQALPAQNLVDDINAKVNTVAQQVVEEVQSTVYNYAVNTLSQGLSTAAIFADSLYQAEDDDLD